MKKSISILLTVSLLAGCAGTGAKFAPMVDGGDPQKYRKDLAECQAYADQLASAGDAAVAGAVLGAGIGILLAVMTGGRGDGFGRAMAGAGAVGGTMGAAGRAETDQRGVIRKCLAGRGYNILN